MAAGGDVTVNMTMRRWRNGRDVSKYDDAAVT